ncbi:MAG: hypothetical protein ACYC6Y_13950 [Thermoguttaceae bacterium]
MAAPIPDKRTEPWQRFTVLDALLMQVGYALAFALVLSPYRRMALQPLDEGTVIIALTALCLGSAFSGPIVLGSHWLFRGRRAGMSAGEWLWISPAAILLIAAVGVWALHWIAQMLPDPDGIRAVSYALLGILLFLLEAGCVMNALIVVMARSVGDLDHPPCWWTDRFGALTCLLLGVFVLLTVFAVFS